MHRIAFAVAAMCGIFMTLPALAQGEILITQAKALAGNVTPGDTAGYPITLTQPGAYILGSNLTVTGGKHGIQVNAHNVDIDMKGFLLTGAGGGTYGIISGYGESRVHNGVINRFLYSGIYLRNNAWTIEDMKIVRNGGMGIDATSAQFISVNNSIVANNIGIGVYTGNDGAFQGSTISSNRYGIVCGENCRLDENIVSNNRGRGIFASSGIITENIISNNLLYGIIEPNPVGDLGLANNMLVGNNAGGDEQISGTIDVHPNTCVGKPC